LLGALAGDEREVWWVHGARNGAEHAEARELLSRLPAARLHVR
jgi:ferredoxin-NADP reductase